MEPFSYNKLKGRIVEKFGSQSEFSKKIPLSPQSVSKKLVGNSGFSQSDINRWCELLDIDTADIGSYFFT